jgi:DNA-directed RNA polymerase subunit M/transcription elongation factor TFIIS
MAERFIPSQKCPKCGSTEYQFRSRKTIVLEKDQGEAVETKYRCKACGHEWRARTPVHGTG